MDLVEKQELKKKIDQAKVVSFDVFDTLLFRIVNTPETIFDLVGQKFQIPGFRLVRKWAQDEASRRVYGKYQYPHADIDQIYEVLSERKDLCGHWMDVKECEIQMEKDALKANREMVDVFRYAVSSGKRVIVVSDMYLFAQTISEVLDREGFTGIGKVYCSADEHKAKFNKELFREVQEKEGVPFEDFLHIGDNARDDGEYPSSFGMQTFVYKCQAGLDKLKDVADSDMDQGLYKYVFDQRKSFWYNLGAEVGGPLYMGLSLWLTDKIKDKKQPVFCLSRDGWNLCHILKDMGYENVQYLYASRRALLLAGIRSIDEESVRQLPPFVTGQTVGEILDYLCIPRKKFHHLDKAGFDSFDDVITDTGRIEDFKKLYYLNPQPVLERCEYERKNAREYFDRVGLLKENPVVFDCGWNGSSQFLLDRVLEAIGSDVRPFFYYFGIINSEKSRRQLHGRHYEAFAFDFYRNYSLQRQVEKHPVLYELFFSAPHASVLYYETGTVKLEDTKEELYKDDILQGIVDYLKAGFGFARKYDVSYRVGLSIGHLNRLIALPTEEEAIRIGDIEDPDGFARKKENATRVAYVTEEMLSQPGTGEGGLFEAYWPEAVFKRPDISDELKKKYAEKIGMAWPPEEPSEYHLEDGTSIRNYERWYWQQEKQGAEKPELAYQPFFSVVIPVYNTDSRQLREAIESVLAQSYSRFELILVDDHSSWESVVPVLKSYEENPHVELILRQVNGNISAATNDGIHRASGEFIVFMDCDDVMGDDALYEFAAKLNENKELDFIYSDEDKITEDGKIRHMPNFKPDWSPDLFLSMMYTNHLAIYRASIVKKVGGLRSAFNGSQDYDMTLRFMEYSSDSRVGHIPKVLYHWRERKESVAFAMSSKNYAAMAAMAAKEDYLRRNRIPAKMEYIDEMDQCYPVYEPVGSPLVSIIIPTKDHPEVLERCINSICSFTDYPDYEIVVVDNGSREENRQEMEAFLADKKAAYLYEKMDFNFSKMCNRGAAAAKGEYLLFLNDDIEIIQAGWLRRLLGQAQQPRTGAVGAKLFYPETTLIQHDGVANEEGRGPVHQFLGSEDGNTQYMGMNRVVFNTLVVTGACLMVKKEKFNEAGRFREDLPVAYNDVDLCFTLYERGYYNVLRNDVAAYHYESLSRGKDDMDEEKYLRLLRELSALYERHPALKGKDPFLNKNLSFFSTIVVPKENADRIEKVDMPQDFTEEVMGSYDHVIQEPVQGGRAQEGMVEITGWCCMPSKGSQVGLKQYLLLQDPYGDTYQVPAHHMLRKDVAENLEGGKELYFSGFECLVPKDQLKWDSVLYNLGLRVVEPDGTSHSQWLGRQNNLQCAISEKDTIFPQVDAIMEDGTYECKSRDLHIIWNLEEAGLDEDGVLGIKGWAFFNGDGHYKFRTKILLKDESDGTAYRLKAEPKRRLDVANAFPRTHFLLDCGFYASAYYLQLPRGREFEIILRLENQFDPEKMQDVLTGRKIFIPEDLSELEKLQEKAEEAGEAPAETDEAPAETGEAPAARQ